MDGVNLVSRLSLSQRQVRQHKTLGTSFSSQCSVARRVAL